MFGVSLRTKEDKIEELKDQLRLMKTTRDMINAEYTLEHVPRAVFLLLKQIDRSGRLSKLYLKSFSLINYMAVCGTGVLINMKVIGIFFNLGFGLYISNMLAILSAFTWNWMFSVGPLGYLFGLSPKRKKISVEIDHEDLK